MAVQNFGLDYRYNPQRKVSPIPLSGNGQNPSSLMPQYDEQGNLIPTSSATAPAFNQQEFAGNAGSLLSAIGLALMSSPRNAPLLNFPSIFPGIMRGRQDQAQQQRTWDFIQERTKNAPDVSMLFGAPGGGAEAATGGAGDAGAGGVPMYSATPAGFSSGLRDPRGVAPLIRAAFSRYGHDPETGIKVAQSEGLGTFLGDSGKSGSAFQLYTGGGLGNEFQQETGLDPLDPKNEPAAIEWVARNLSRTGWGPYHGAAKIGVGPRQGIGVSQAGPPDTVMPSAGLPGPRPTPVSYQPGNSGQAGAVGALSQTEPQTAAVASTPPFGGGTASAPSLTQYAQAQAQAQPQPQLQPATDAAPGPREIAQARAYMPTTQPPQRPDMVQGQRTQQAVAAKSFQYWARTMEAASLLGDSGKGLMEAAKVHIDLAKGFLTPTDLQRHAAAAFPNNPAAQERAIRLALPNSSEGAYASQLGQDQAKLQNYGAFKRIDVLADNERLTELQKNLSTLPPGQRQELTAGAIPGNATPEDIKKYQAYVADEAKRGNNQPLSMFDWGMRRLTAGATMINTTEGREAASYKARLAVDVDAAKEAGTAASAAQRLMPVIDEVARIANLTPEGWAGPAAATAAAVFSGVGIPISDGMSNAELLRALNQRLIPTVREPGQQSNAEMNNYLRATPGLIQSASGRLKIAAMTKAIAQRAIEISRIRRDNLGKSDLYEKLAALDSKPIFTNDQRNTINATPGGAVLDEETLKNANDALARGVSRDAIKKHMRDNGFDPSGF